MRFVPFLPVLAILSTPPPEDEEAAALLLSFASSTKPGKRTRMEDFVVAEPWEFSLESAIGDYRSIVDGTYPGFHSTPDDLQMVMTGNSAFPFLYSLIGPLLSQRMTQTVFRAMRTVNAEVEYIWDLVPKYSVDPNAPHRGLRQFWFRKRAYEFNLCPPPFGISSAFPPASVADSRFSKALEPTMRANMVRNEAIEMVAVASTSVHLDLESIKKLPGALSPAIALKLGIAIVQKLGVLHQQARIVHGNLQPSAITMENGTVVGFRDFDASRFLKPNNEPIEIPQRGEAVNLPIDRFSPPEPFDPIRNDLYRALTIVVWLTQKTDVRAPPAEELPREWEYWRRANQFRMEGILWNESFSNGITALIKLIHNEPVSESLYSTILLQLADLVRLAQQALLSKIEKLI